MCDGKLVAMAKTLINDDSFSETMVNIKSCMQNYIVCSSEWKVKGELSLVIIECFGEKG